jgi:hypothetical protein
MATKQSLNLAIITIILLSVISICLFMQKPQGDDNSFIGFQRAYLPQENLSFVGVAELKEVNIAKIRSFGNKLYGYNFSQATLYELDRSGLVLNKIGKRGKGPGEFEHVDFIYIDSSRFIFLDTDQARATEVSVNGVVKNIWQSKYAFSRGVCLTPNRYLVTNLSENNLSSTEERFLVLSPRANLRQDILVPRLVRGKYNDPDINELETDGIFIHSQSDKVFRLSLMTGQFICFDTAGKFLYNVFTVDKSGIPKIVSQKYGSTKMVSFSPDARTINYDAAANEKFFFVLSNAAHPEIKQVKEGKNEETVIDIYNSIDGSYRCSIRLPKIDLSNPKADTPKSIALSTTGFYILCGTYIYEYSLNLEAL